jgi:hypothetical protein
MLLFARETLAQSGITFGQIDDFQDATTMGWSEGPPSPNPPTNEPDGGPLGAGDRYLRNVSAGDGTAGGKQIMFNRAQWAGDYNDAGVTRLSAMIANFGDAPLYPRVAILDNTGSRFATTTPTPILPDQAWHPVVFDLTAAGMSNITGLSTLATALSNVTELRLLSAKNVPTYFGDDVPAIMGVDDLRALRQPGDATFDGRVDFNDLVALAQHYNTPEGTTWADGDFNFDGKVDFNDLVTLAQNYNGATSAEPVAGLPAALAPEPSSIALVAVGLTALGPRRRRS